MPIESATYIGQLVSANPGGGDDRSQGDDHIRLLKSTLGATFPNATKSFYFPQFTAITVDTTVLAAGQNTFFQADATAASIAITLPVLSAALQGWYFDIQKSDATANAVTILGTINGATNLVLSLQNAHARVLWTGTAWRAFVTGQFSAGIVPAGSITLAMLATEVVNRLVPAGSVFSSILSAAPTGYVFPFGQNLLRATYPVLFAAIGTTFGVGDGSTTFGIPDFSGRSYIFRDNMSGAARNVAQVSKTINTTNGNSNAVVSSASGLCEGMFIASANVPAGTKISSMNGTTITMSASATGTASGTAARFSMVTDAQVLGALGGSMVEDISENQMPLHGHPTRMSLNSGSTSDATGGLMVSTNSTLSEPAFSGAVANTPGRQVGGTGDDQPHANVPPSIIVNAILKAH